MSQISVVQDQEQEASPGQPNRSHKILLVDDEQKFMIRMQKIIHSVGLHVDTCDNPENALDMLQTQGPYAIILSDNRMKGLRDSEFLQKARQLSPNSVRIIATAYYDNQMLEDIINHTEPYRFLKKPVDSKVMIISIKEGLKKYEDNLKLGLQLQQIEKLKHEGQTAQAQSQKLKGRIADLEKSIRRIAISIALVFVTLVAGLGIHQLLQSWEIKDNSLRVDNWTLYPNQTVVDPGNHLRWMTVDFQNLVGRAPRNWNEAKEWAAQMNQKKFAGFSDWRIPTIEEYKATYDPQLSSVGYDRREDLRVGYPKVFEDGGGFGFWAADDTGPSSAAYFFFIGGYDKVVSRTYESPAMSVRLVRDES